MGRRTRCCATLDAGLASTPTALRDYSATWCSPSPNSDHSLALRADGVAHGSCPAQVLEAFADIDARLLPQHYGTAMSRSPSSGNAQVPLSAEQRAEVARQLNADVLPTMLSRIEAVLLATEGPWYCGDRLTICDIVSFCIVDGMSDGSYVPGVGRSVFEGCPALLEHAECVRALPAVAKWLARAGS